MIEVHQYGDDPGIPEEIRREIKSFLNDFQRIAIAFGDERRQLFGRELLVEPFLHQTEKTAFGVRVITENHRCAAMDGVEYGVMSEFTGDLHVDAFRPGEDSRAGTSANGDRLDRRVQRRADGQS